MPDSSSMWSLVLEHQQSEKMAVPARSAETIPQAENIRRGNGTTSGEPATLYHGMLVAPKVIVIIISRDVESLTWSSNRTHCLRHASILHHQVRMWRTPSRMFLTLELERDLRFMSSIAVSRTTIQNFGRLVRNCPLGYVLQS